MKLYKHPQQLPVILRRFLVDGSGCWIWTGAHGGSGGYGRIKLRGRVYYVHRVVYALAHGRVPSGKIVCHSCDRPRCANPAHLSAGTHHSNLKHQYLRGRRRPREIDDALVPASD